MIEDDEWMVGHLWPYINTSSALRIYKEQSEMWFQTVYRVSYLATVLLNDRPEEQFIPCEHRGKLESSTCTRGRSCNHWQLQEDID